MAKSPYDQAPASNTGVIRPSSQSRAMGWVITISAIFLVVLCTLINVGLVALETGPSNLIVGGILAILPVPIYVALALWLDRFEAEPPRLLLAAFFWGAAIATFFASIFNTISYIVIAGMFGEELGDIGAAVLSAPLVEEVAKGLALFIFYLWKNDEFDGVVDGIVYATMVGLGFAMTENIAYYARAAQESADVTAVTFALRGLMGPYAHPLFTSMTGIGLGFARQSANRNVKIFAPLGGLLLAMLLHATWNLTSSLGIAFFLAYLLVMAPVFGGVLVLIYFSLRREGNLIRQQLLRDMQRGRISPAEFEALVSTSGRMRASWRALLRGGFNAWRAQGQVHQLESELAFHRWRISQGIHRADEREAQYLQRLYALRTQTSSVPGPRNTGQ